MAWVNGRVARLLLVFTQPAVVLLHRQPAAAQSSSDSTPYTSISVRSAHACAMAPDGAADCWSWNLAGITSPPLQDQPYSQLSAGFTQTCAMTSGTVVCWGNPFSTHT